MIFVNTAEIAKELSTALRDEGLEIAEFHKLMMTHDKQENLRMFRQGLVNLLVCTDHAARGLDLSGVRHVIQAEFALNVVQYLHRIGRASRGGQAGRATSLFDDRSLDLVNSILSEGESKSVEQSFSRNRGFRAKIKKVHTYSLAGLLTSFKPHTYKTVSHIQHLFPGYSSLTRR